MIDLRCPYCTKPTPGVHRCQCGKPWCTVWVCEAHREWAEKPATLPAKDEARS